MKIKRIAVIIAMTFGTIIPTTAAVSVMPTDAGAASCFKTVTVAGKNSIGYARPSSLQSHSPYVRTAPVATLCINYAKAYGGYYFASVSCSQSSARLTGDSTSLRRSSNYLNHIQLTSASCGATATWKWTRTIGNDQCVSLNAQSRWAINQSTGGVSRNLDLAPDGFFVPASC